MKLNSKLILFTCLSCIVFAQAAIGDAFINQFEYSKELSPVDEHDVQLFWTVDLSKKNVEFGIITKNTGWFGLGVSDKGTMKGADMAILSKDKTNNFIVEDYFSKDFITPVKDPNGRQNVVLLSATQNATHSAYHIRRPLQTCDDEHDVDIGSQPIWIMYAQGQRNEFEYHGISRGAKFISLILDHLNHEEPELEKDLYFDASTVTKDDLAALKEDETFALDIHLKDIEYVIPEQTTSYTCFKLDLSDRLEGQEFSFNSYSTVTDKLVHHAHIAICDDDAFDQMEDVTENCYVMPSSCRYTMSYSVGVGYLELPEGVGKSIKSHKYLFAVHFENPTNQIGQRTSFGFRPYLQKQPFQKQLSLFSVNASHKGINIPPLQTSSTSSYCPKECLAKFPDGGVHLSIAFLHAHKRAKKIRLRHMRNGIELPLLGETDYYDFNKQTTLLMERVILPNDSLLLECEYIGHESDTVVGGYSSDDEMCIAMLALHSEETDLPQACAESVLNPGEYYCGTDLHEAQDDGTWTPEFIIKDVEKQPFEELSNEDEMCNMVAYGTANPFTFETFSSHFALLLVLSFFVLKAFEIMLQKQSPAYELLSYPMKRNVVVYCYSLLFLTLSLVITLAAGFQYLLGEEFLENDSWTGKLIEEKKSLITSAGIQLVGVVMLVELLAKGTTDLMLAVHHILTVAIIAVLYMSFYGTFDSAYFAIGMILSLHASMEQPAYIALVRKRLGVSKRSVAREFKIVAWYTLFQRLFVLVLSTVWYLNMDFSNTRFDWLSQAHWNSIIQYLAPVLVLLLFIIQLRQVRIFFAISAKALKECEAQSDSKSVESEGSEESLDEAIIGV